MSNEISGCTDPLIVYVVMCYQSIVGVYVSQDDAFQVQSDLISKNRPVNIFCRPVIFPNV